MIKVFCERCTVQLERQGGLLFSAPDVDQSVRKTHLCGMCYITIMSEIAEYRSQKQKPKKELHILGRNAAINLEGIDYAQATPNWPLEDQSFED